MVSLFYIRNYRLLFSATAVSNLGDGISALAFPWLATLITRDPLLISLVAVATRLPWLLFSIPAGVWTDRVDRRRLMVQADLVRLALTTGVVALILTAPAFPVDNGTPYIFALCGLAFLLGSAEVLRDNAAQTALPSVVDKDKLEAANGQIWSVEQVMGAFVGPPLAGVLIAYAVPAPFVMDAATFAIAALLVWAMRMPATEKKPERRQWTVEAREGVSWLLAHRAILQLALILGFMNALTIMVLTMLPLFGQELLGLNAAQYGLLITAEAAGGVVGGLICPWIVTHIGARRALMLSLPLMMLSSFLIAFFPTVWVVAPALFIGLFAGLLWNVVTVPYRQRHLPDALLGRVNSLYRFFGWGMLPIGAFLAGAMVSWAEPYMGRELALRLPYFVSGSGLAIIWGYAVLRLKI